MSLLDNIENLLLALQIKQSKYKYDFSIERIFNQKTKTIWQRNTIVKYHTEKKMNDITGEMKRVKVQDIKVTGSQTSCVLWLSKEYNNLLGVDSS